jgi:hypothetical protein
LLIAIRISKNQGLRFSKKIAKCEKDCFSPRIQSPQTHLGFHAMVINGQPKTQNPNEKKGAQK